MKRKEPVLCLLAVIAAVWVSLGVSVAMAQPFIYVANAYSDNASVIDTASNTVVATVGVGTYPYGVAITPDGSRAYVTNISSNNVSVIDTASNVVITTVGVGSNPIGVTITPDGTRA